MISRFDNMNADIFDKFDKAMPENAEAKREPISASELAEKKALFTIEDIRVKYDMETKFGSKDTAIVDITLETTGEQRVAFFTQSVLFKKMEFLVEEGVNYTDAVFRVTSKQSKAGSPYYDIVNL